MKRKILAIVLCAAMVVCFMPTFSFAATSGKLKVGDNDGDGVINITALGDSIAAGFGIDGFTMATAYTKDWHNGFQLAPDAAYSKQLATKIKDNYGQNKANVWSGAMCAVRAEDVINLIDVNKFGADDYFHKTLYENSYKLSYLNPEKSGPMNPLTYSYVEPYYYPDLLSEKQLNRVYKQNIKDADLITITAGGNNYFSYLSGKLMNIFMPMDMSSMYQLPEGVYCEYSKMYVYPYNIGDEWIFNEDNPGYIMGKYTYSTKKISKRTAKYVQMNQGEINPNTYAMTMTIKPFNGKKVDVDAVKAYVQMMNATGMMTVTYQEDPTEAKTVKEYLEDVRECYGSFDKRFKYVYTLDAFNKLMTKVSSEAMGQQTLNEDLSKFYSKTLVRTYNTARAAAIASARLADKLGKTQYTTSVTAIFDFLKSYLYSMGALEEAMPMIVEYIHELNPDADIIITSLPPAFCDFEISMGQGQPTTKLADFLPGFYASMFSDLQKIAAKNSSFCRAVDITKAEMVSQEIMREAYKKYGPNAKFITETNAMMYSEGNDANAPVITYLGDGITDSCGNQYHTTVPATDFMMCIFDMSLSHPSADGHKYIARQIYNECDFSVVSNKGWIAKTVEKLVSAIQDRVFNRKSLFERIFGFDLRSVFDFNIMDMFRLF